MRFAVGCNLARAHENPQMIQEQALHNYRHFLERLVRENPHQLSDVEEKLIIEKRAPFKRAAKLDGVIPLSVD